MTVTGRRLREHQMRRELILESAKTLFEEKGFDQTTVDEIAAVAELGKGTIYSYFKSKEEIFIAVLESGLEVLEKRMALAVEQETSAIAILYRLYDTFISYHQEKKGFIETLFVQVDQQLFLRLGGLVSGLKSKAEVWRDLIRSVLQKGIEQGEFKQFDAEKMSQIIIGMIIGIIVQHEMGQTDIDLVDYRSLVFQLTLDGLEKK